MTCGDFEDRVDPFLDNELDLAESQEIQRHVEQCSNCETLYATRLAVRQSLQNPGVRFVPPADLRDQIHAGLLKEIRPTRPQRTSWLPAFQLPNWLVPSLAGAAVVLVVWLGSNIFLTQGRSSGLLTGTIAAQLVSDHLRSLLANHLIDVVSTDEHTVKPWFAGKLSFSPPVFDLSDQGFKLLGGRLDYLDDHEIAAVVFQHKQHYINLFVWPKSLSVHLPEGTLQKEGFNLSGWEANGLTMWAVTDAAPDTLKSFVDLQKQKQSESGGEPAE